MPINIAVPGNRSPRGEGAGQTLKLLLQPRVRLWPEAGAGPAPMLKVPERGGTQRIRMPRREPRAGTREGARRGGRGIHASLPEAARPRRSPKRKLVRGDRHPSAVGDQEPRGPGEVGTLTLLWLHSRRALQQKFDIRKLVASSPPPCQTVIISSHRHVRGRSVVTRWKAWCVQQDLLEGSSAVFLQ